jgi:hypothetical protein
MLVKFQTNRLETWNMYAIDRKTATQLLPNRIREAAATPNKKATIGIAQ